MPEENLKPNGSGIHRIVKACLCSTQGFQAAFIYESAFRQELALCLLLFPLSFLIADTPLEWLLLNTTLLLMLFAELVNSAIEALADSVSIAHHELLGRAKDLGSAAVFTAISLLVITWVVVGLS